MRRSREDAAETRRRIVETASRLFRLRGIASVSVADIMGALGLTIGGFYRHFESKEALVIEAIEAASEETASRYAKRAGAVAEAPVSTVLDGYLSRAHRDHAEVGCPVAALCSEVAHEGLPTRKAFTKSVQRLLESVARLAPGDSKDARDRRLQAVASMVGAVVLSRATSDEALADDLLRVVRRGLVPQSRSTAANARRRQRASRRSPPREDRRPGST